MNITDLTVHELRDKLKNKEKYNQLAKEFRKYKILTGTGTVSKLDAAHGSDAFPHRAYQYR